ncbi:MAG: PEP-CTERM sorting domain-containing protein [Okeania sp. SIO2B3]|nr:PEP-CTERM sorting domain-containing protein [Okeania sp. SIO2B3]
MEFPDLPVVHDATIGDNSAHLLLDDVPDDIEVLKLSGFFNATNPDKPNAHFNIIVAGIEPGGPGEFTFFLPTSTDIAANVIIDVADTKALADNKNYFVDGGGFDWMPEVITNDLPQAGEGVTIGDWFIGIGSNQTLLDPTMGFNVPNAMFQPHGTQTTIPEPSSTIGLLALTTLGLGSALKRKIKK